MLSEENIHVQIENWREYIDSLLDAHPQGISEYDMITQLRSNGYLHELESKDAPLGGLFTIHFMLMHVVYLLQQQARRQTKSDITISPFNIQKHHYRSGEQALTTPDQLSLFYLDLKNLFTTTEDDINQWLDNFWTRYLAGEDRQQAMAILDLSEPVSRKEVEKRYRQLAMKHHPDRGGDAAQLAKINHAVDVLRKIVTK